MKLLPLTLAGLSIAGLSIFSHAQAQSYGKGISIYAGGGYYAFSSDLGIDNSSFPSIGIEYRMTDSLALELNYLASETTEQFNDLAKFDVEQLRLDGNYYFMPERKLQPYLSAGFGVFNLSQVEKNIDLNDTIADVGGGVRYFFSENFSIRSDLRAINNIDAGYTDALLNIGLNLILGGNSVSNEGDIDLVKGASDPAAPIDTDIDADGIADASDDCLDTQAGLMVDENGCPIPIESTVSMDLNVNFEFESAELPPEFYSDVKELATFLKLYKESEVVIEGHADSTGPEKFNQGLSERRAKAIRDILVRDFEIERDRLKYVGYGESRPIADNQSEEGRSKNRRAATVVTATREPKSDTVNTKAE